MSTPIDLDEPPLFDLDEMHEPDAEDDGAHVPRGGRLRLEGVTIPFDIQEHGNGRLPSSALVEIGIHSHRLHRDAAAAFARWRSHARAAGIDLTCTDSYRTFAQQEDLKRRKPFWSATPGRSVHGWGFAVDVSIGLPPKPFGQSVLNWLKENGPPNGWFLGRPKDEPWHWVYRGAGTADTSPTPAAQHDVAESVGQAMTSVAEVALGSTGRAVRIARGLLRLEQTDRFDAETDRAARAFQGTNDLTVDGRIGPKTWGVLRSVTAPAVRPEVRVGADGEAVDWIQRRLGAVADGDFGPVTRGAVLDFQTAARLAVDGVVGPRTWGALTR